MSDSTSVVLNKILAIQALRAVACMAVITSHAIGRANRDISTRLQGSIENPEWVIIGHFGVDLFFVLSGFLMYLVHHNDFGQPRAAMSFLKKRITRVVPIYWGLSLLALLALLIAPNLFSYRSEAELHWVIGSFLFIPTTTSYGVTEPLLGVGWTLNYEMHFYLAFAFALLFNKRRGLAMLFALLAGLAVYGLGLPGAEQRQPWLGLLTSPMLLEFLLGIAIAIAYEKFQGPLTLWWPVFLLLGGVIIFTSLLDIPRSQDQRIYTWGLGSGFVLLGAILAPKTRNGQTVKLLAKLGNASYSAYLLQVFTLPTTFHLVKWTKASAFLGHIGTVLLMITATWIISLAFFRFVERPITKALNRKSSHKMRPLR